MLSTGPQTMLKKRTFIHCLKHFQTNRELH